MANPLTARCPTTASGLVLTEMARMLIGLRPSRMSLIMRVLIREIHGEFEGSARTIAPESRHSGDLVFATVCQ